MSLVLVVLLAAVAVGRLLGGRLWRLGELRLRSRWLLFGALGLQVVGAVVGGPAYPVGLAASALLVLVFLGRNRSLRGSGLIALGLLANALVVGLNGAMPVSAAAAARAGVPLASLLGDARHQPATAGSRLRVLSDVVPVPLPLRPEVVSPGDVLVAAGLGQLVVLAMLSGATPRAGAPRSRPRPHLPPISA